MMQLSSSTTNRSQFVYDRIFKKKIPHQAQLYSHGNISMLNIFYSNSNVRKNMSVWHEINVCVCVCVCV